MNGIRTRNSLPTHGVPEDLLIFRGRMADLGVQVRLPTAGPSYQLPEPFPILDDELTLTETLLRMRDSGV